AALAPPHVRRRAVDRHDRLAARVVRGDDAPDRFVHGASPLATRESAGFFDRPTLLSTTPHSSHERAERDRGTETTHEVRHFRPHGPRRGAVGGAIREPVAADRGL